VLHDVSSSWLEGRCCELARFGYSRDGKKGKLQIVYGLLCAADGCPVAVEVFEGKYRRPDDAGAASSNSALAYLGWCWSATAVCKNFRLIRSSQHQQRAMQRWRFYERYDRKTVARWEIRPAAIRALLFLLETEKATILMETERATRGSRRRTSHEA
jgi:hypothetical protein